MLNKIGADLRLVQHVKLLLGGLSEEAFAGALAKDEEVTVFYKGYEDKLANDIHVEVFLAPTANPTVTVIHPASLAVYVQFSSTAEKEHERELHSGNDVTSQWALKGMMLPSQPIIIRWWPKDQQLGQTAQRISSS